MGVSYDYFACDYCGKTNPETFPGGRLTKCCSTYDKNNKNCFYNTLDEDGLKVYSIGKKYAPINSSCEDLKYHSSWDRLMLVVEKINKDAASIKIQFGNVNCIAKIDYPVQITNVDPLAIVAVWKTVVYFIKWYNSQPH